MKIIIKNGNITFKTLPNEITFDKLYDINGNERAYNESISVDDTAYLNATNGEVSGKAANYLITNYEIIAPYKSFTYNGKFNTPLIPLGVVCFYDADKKFIGSYGTGDTCIEKWETTNGTKTGTVPAGSVYMRSMHMTSSNPVKFSITFYK